MRTKLPPRLALPVLKSSGHAGNEFCNQGRAAGVLAGIDHFNPALTMTSSTLAMNFPIARGLPLSGPRNPTPGKADGDLWVGNGDAKSRPTLTMARACAREVAIGNRLESSWLLLLGVCALLLLANCATQADEFAANWDTFQRFVHTMIA